MHVGAFAWCPGGSAVVLVAVLNWRQAVRRGAWRAAPGGAGGLCDDRDPGPALVRGAGVLFVPPGGRFMPGFAAIRAEGERFVAALPLYHVFALQVNGFVPLMIGASIFMIANPRDIPALVKALRRTPFTAIPGVNTLFNALLNDKDFAETRLLRLHLAIGGGMAVQRVGRRAVAINEPASPLIEAYGLTETSPGAIADPLDIDHFTGAIGLPMPSTDIALGDDDGRDLKPGEAGGLCVKGPQVMAGYWNRPDETAKVMTADGFLRTGDIAR